MRDLEHALRELGSAWAPPATPDVAATVMAQLPGRPRRVIATRTRVRFAAAFAALVVGAVAAIAPAREAVLNFFDVGAVRVTTSTSPVVVGPTRPDEADLGVRTTADGARRAIRFSLADAAGTALAKPDDVFLRGDGETAIVTLVWRDLDGRIEALLSQARGSLLMEKFIDPGKPPTRIAVDGAAGYWFTGGPHGFGYLDGRGELVPGTSRLAANVLLWERAGVTYRLEGVPSLDGALAVARDLR